MTNEEFPRSKVRVQFHSSSTKDGREAYLVDVLEGADVQEASRVYDLALSLRNRAKTAINGPTTEQQLEASIDRERIRVPQPSTNGTAGAGPLEDLNKKIDAAEEQLPK